jgi:DNA invertase Pin-like site-specific DNA recombinase
MTGKFVSYCRVSTKKQGRSGLGLEAQRESISNYLNGGHWTLINEFVEIESGKRDDRPKLDAALRECRIHHATLLVAKLDRLARDVAFISKLMKEEVKFVAADCPEANTLTLHVLAAMAQYEAECASARTKAGLAVVKARGKKLGGLKWDITQVSAKGRKLALQTRQERAAKYRGDVLPAIQDIQEHGANTLQKIADALNERGIGTRRGGTWSPVQVQRVLSA